MQNHKPQILIVEDEKSLLKAWVDRFRKEGLNVLTARDGTQALNLALSLHPDLVLVDLVMPSSDGLTLIKKLKEDKWGFGVPVMFLSGWLNPEQSDKSYEDRTIKDDQLGNDWSLDQVVNKVKEKLKFAQQSPAMFKN